MRSVHVGRLCVCNCTFFSNSRDALRELISSVPFMRELNLYATAYTSELLLNCARRPELTTLHVDEPHVGTLDAALLSLMFRDVGGDIDVTVYAKARQLEASISDEFSKRLLEVSCVFSFQKVLLTEMTAQQMCRFKTLQLVLKKRCVRCHKILFRLNVWQIFGLKRTSSKRKTTRLKILTRKRNSNVGKPYDDNDFLKIEKGKLVLHWPHKDEKRKLFTVSGQFSSVYRYEWLIMMENLICPQHLAYLKVN